MNAREALDRVREAVVDFFDAIEGGDLDLIRAALTPALPADLAEIQARADALDPLYAEYMSTPWHEASAAQAAEWKYREAVVESAADVPALVAELADWRGRPTLTAEEAREAMEWFDLYYHRMAGMVPEPSESVSAKLRAIAEGATINHDKPRSGSEGATS